MAGPVDYFLLFFFHVCSRRVHLVGITLNPTVVWIKQQARNVTMMFDQKKGKPTMLLRDNDKKFPSGFGEIFAADDVTVKRTAVVSPNQNAYVERWIQSLQQECLDHFTVFGEDHLRLLVTEYLDYYNTTRPHQSLGKPPNWDVADEATSERTEERGS